MNVIEFNRLKGTDLNSFPESENNVKHRIVIPFLRCFGHNDPDFEHAAQGSRIDINIENRIIVETKSLSKNLDEFVQQLGNYSIKELPVISILSNGRQFRIYSPQWRKEKNFSDKLIYQFELSDLGDVELLNRLERILDVSNYENETYLDNLNERENEISGLKKRIGEIKENKNK